MRQNKPLYQLLQTDNNSTLSRLCRHAQYLSRLTTQLQTCLQPPLNEHCTVANYTNATLVIYTDTSAWAARLRYNTPAILTYMRDKCALPELKTLRIRIKPDTRRSDIHPARPEISRASAAIITHTASLMPEDELRLSLLRLASHAKKTG